MVMAKAPASQIGMAFVKQYYTLIHDSPESVHRFYSHDSRFVHGGIENGKLSECKPACGQKEIDDRIAKLGFADTRTKIRQVDTQFTLGEGVVIQVSGLMSNNAAPMRPFTQTFVLACQSFNNYYVYNDIFRYQDEPLSDDEEPVEGSSGIEEDAEDAQLDNTDSSSSAHHHNVASATTDGLGAGDGTDGGMGDGQGGGYLHHPHQLQQPHSLPSSTVAGNKQHLLDQHTSQPLINGHANQYNNISAPTADSAPVPTSQAPAAVPALQEVVVVQEQDEMLQDQDEQESVHVESEQLEETTEGHQLEEEVDVEGEGAQTEGEGSPQRSQPTLSPLPPPPPVAPSQPKTFANLFKKSATPATSTAASTTTARRVSSSAVATAHQQHREQQEQSREHQHREQRQEDKYNDHSQPPSRQPSHTDSHQHSQHQSQHSQQSAADSAYPSSNAGGDVYNNSNNNMAGPGGNMNGPPRRPIYPDAQQIFVGNLPTDVDNQELIEHFEQFGAVVDVKINSSKGKMGQQSRNTPFYGFIAFESAEVVQQVLSNKPIRWLRNGQELRLNIEHKQSRPMDGGRGGGRGYSRGGGGMFRGRGGGYGRGGGVERGRGGGFQGGPPRR